MQDISEKKYTVREALDALCQVLGGSAEIASDEFVKKVELKLERKSVTEYEQYLRLKAIFE